MARWPGRSDDRQSYSIQLQAVKSYKKKKTDRYSFTDEYRKTDGQQEAAHRLEDLLHRESEDVNMKSIFGIPESRLTTNK